MTQTREAANVLVTGATGTVGRRVIQELHDRGLGARIVQFEGDVASRVDVQKCLDRAAPVGSCVNLAAVVPVSDAKQNPIRAYQVNAIGVGIVVEEVSRRFENPYILHCSTSHVYGSSTRPLTEGSPTAPVSTYGRSKLAGELLASDVAESRNAQLGVARVFSLWAEDQTGSFLYPSLKAKFQASLIGEPVRVSGGNNVRDFLHARTVARMLTELFAREASGVVNVGSGEGTTVLDFARIHAPSGVPVESDDVPEPNAIVANIDRLLELLHE